MSKFLVRQVRDLMATRDFKPRVIDRFVAEVNRSSPAVVRSLCRGWLEKLGRPQPDEDRQSAVSDQQLAVSDQQLAARALYPGPVNGQKRQKCPARPFPANTGGRPEVTSYIKASPGVAVVEILPSVRQCPAETWEDCRHCEPVRFLECGQEEV